MKKKFLFFIPVLIIALFLFGCTQNAVKSTDTKSDVIAPVDDTKSDVVAPVATDEIVAPVSDDTKSNVVAPVADTPVIDENKMVDCTDLVKTDPFCFLTRMNKCLPVTLNMTGSGSNEVTAIKVTILGVENNTCHFQRELNGVMDLDCFFPKGTLNTDTFDQMFGNDKGKQQVVDDACITPGW